MQCKPKAKTSQSDPYETATRVSRAIVAILDAEVHKSEPNPMQILLGTCLSMMVFLETAPPSKGKIEELRALEASLRNTITLISDYIEDSWTEAHPQ
jgi:hypothetical protein